jgi:hypothetical protein
MRKIPIKGVVVCSGDEKSEHSHKLYITSWDGRPVHVHPFAGVTSYDIGHEHPHVHRYGGTTGNPLHG